MSQTYTQIHIHAVFAVQNRESIINKSWRERLYRYIIAIIQKHGHKVLSIGGTDDHIHILFGARPKQSISSLMAEVKRDSAEWINQKQLTAGRFEWQEGYGAFSYSKSQIPDVAAYIENQEERHAKRSFAEEFRNILDNRNIEYEKQYIFHDVNNAPLPSDAPLRGAG